MKFFKIVILIIVSTATCFSQTWRSNLYLVTEWLNFYSSVKVIYLLFPIIVITLNITAQNTSKLIRLEANGRLKYIPDNLGNVIPDFSNVGYRDGESDIPNVPVIKTISYISGDILPTFRMPSMN